MTKKTKDKKEEEVVIEHTPEQAERNKELEGVSSAIQTVLTDSGYGLQPYLSFSEYGVQPGVRLVKAETDESA